jgi:F-type H+-transporting ATPase subunit a
MHQLPVTALLNHLFASPVNALLHLLGLHAAHAEAPIPDYVAMQIVVVVFLTIVFLVTRASLSVDKPGALQHVFEGVYDFMDGQSVEIIGHENKRYLSYLITLGLFILCSNLLGLIPFFETPTGSAAVPLGCAIVTWCYYQMHGLRANGLGYIKHFMGPVWWLSPLMLLIEIFSHLARLMSLTIRLYANMFAGDMVTLIFFSLIPVGVPVLFLGLHFGVALIQTFIFVVLAMVYLGEASAHAH